VNVALRWLGAGGFTLRIGRRMLAVDPCLARLSRARALIGRVQPDQSRSGLAVPWCDCILVTHSHIDTLADVPSIARRTGAVVAGSANACRLLALLGVPARQIREVRPGDRLRLPGFDVEVIPGCRMDVCLGFRVQAGTISLLTDGSCAAAVQAMAGCAKVFLPEILRENDLRGLL
jgi:phosphoribosyl 1,2-cyclic phosphodiesterase